jgi:hypothetical protein
MVVFQTSGFKTNFNIMRYLSNQPEQLEKRDLLGTKNKADSISSFLIKSSKQLENTKIFALYGGWGSGKTTLMRDIEKQLEKENYKTPLCRGFCALNLCVG